MAAFRSLLYREFRLCKKDNIIRAALIASYTVMMWFAVITARGIEEVETGSTANTICVMLSGVCIASCLFLDDVYKSDINSGWLKYSYALPITPLMRSAVRAVRLSITTAAGVIFSVVNAAGFCAVAGNSFGMGHIVLQIAAADLVLVILIIRDLFMFSAKNTEALKKAEAYSSFAIMAVFALAVVLFLKIKGISLQQFLSNDDPAPVTFDIPALSDKLLISLVILVLLITADISVTAYKMRCADRSSAKKMDVKAASRSTNAVFERSHILSGFFYKELVQNRNLIIFTALLPLGLLLLAFVMAKVLSYSSEVSGGIPDYATGNPVRLLMTAAGAFIASSILPSVFQGDDRKVRSYFTVSSPAGVKGYMYCKYLLAFSMNILYMVSCYFTDTLSATLRYAVLGEEAQNLMTLFVAVFYIMLFLCAFDIPFSVRFGANKGSLIKTTALILFALILAVCLALLPESTFQKITGLIVDIFTGKANGTVMLFTAVFPYIAFAAYIFSYKISCKIFMKGVNEYDR